MAIVVISSIHDVNMGFLRFVNPTGESSSQPDRQMDNVCCCSKLGIGEAADAVCTVAKKKYAVEMEIRSEGNAMKLKCRMQSVCVINPSFIKFFLLWINGKIMKREYFHLNTTSFHNQIFKLIWKKNLFAYKTPIGFISLFLPVKICP